MVEHNVQKTINLSPLPLEHREACLCRSFDKLRPGKTLQAIDDFNPLWMKDLLENHFDLEFSDDDFVVETIAGRHVAFIHKPDPLHDDRRSDNSQTVESLAGAVST